MKNTSFLNEEEIRQYTIDTLENYKDSNVYGADLHNELFNTDYYIIGTYKAKEWIGKETFNIIEEIKEYEQDNFGEVNTDFSDPEKVVNMYVYIVGENILNESETLREKWNNNLTNEDIDNIIKEITV